MKKRRILALGLSAALTVGLLAGCGGGTQPTETSPTGGETTPVETGAVATGTNSIRVCFASEPETMDPSLNRTVDGNVMISHLFEGLYKWVDSDPSGDGRNGATAELDLGMAAAEPEVTDNGDGTTTLTESRIVKGNTSALSRGLVAAFLGGNDTFEAEMEQGIAQTLAAIAATAEPAR